MHIYDFLGAPHLHMCRGSDVFQLVLREDKAKPSSVPMLIDGSVKVDGIFCVAAFKNGEFKLFGRSGKELNNVDLLQTPRWLVELAEDLEGLCIQTELKSGQLRQSVFNGAISPNRTKPVEPETAAQLHKNTHHLIDFFDLTKSAGGMTRRQRHQTLLDKGYKYVMPAYWYDMTFAQFMAKAEELIAFGEEGACGHNPNAFYQPGARRADICIKKAREIRLDLRCVAVREGKKGKRLGMAEGLNLEYGDKIIKADLGEGWTDEKRIELLNNPKEAVGHIFEVYAFDKSELGVLRQPKVGQRRDDKTTPDEAE